MQAGGKKMRARIENIIKKIKEAFSSLTAVIEFFIFIGILIIFVTTLTINVKAAFYFLGISFLIIGIVTIRFLLKGGD